MAGTDCDVLVVGAGPTGLMAAYLLARCGVSLRIVDRNAAPAQESRAFAVSARSLELFANLGLVDRVLSQGTINERIDFFISGKRAGGFDFDRVEAPDTPYHFILMNPQSKTEALLGEALQEAGVTVERGVEVTALTQDEGCVRAAATHADGRAIEITARYAIGADGAHSIVRKAAGLSFEGAKYPQSFLLGDVAVDWPLDHARFRVFMHGERIGLFFPLQGSTLSRVMTTDLGGSAGNETIGPEPLELDVLQQAFAQASCQPVTLRDPAWLTRFRTHHRVVDRYRSGRLFVAGDAGHIHSPAGGQGMNTGLQDAANLAWKLAAVLNKGTDDALLDTYESERLPVAREVLRFTDRIFGFAAGQSGWRARARDLLAPAIVGPASEMDAVQTAAFRRFAQIDIHYEESAAVASGGSDQPAAGMRAPNAQLSRHRDLFDLISGYRFHVLALSRRALEQAEVRPLLAALSSLSGPGVETHLVARVAGRHQPGVEPVERPDVFDRYGLPDEGAQAIILVRPDGTIAWRGAGLDVEACGRVLARFVAPAGCGA
ncbi:FAD-dependent monooxygenase [Mangrovicella endophytica]|uniref:FAD-dependent monooxygenase n=1 Tax=Mangrovicella endophytica TaxID=2066697 RepID=UPI0013000BCB|nr:FAD-dependent monooxygenase [Mangrovicella endophytica]